MSIPVVFRCCLKSLVSLMRMELFAKGLRGGGVPTDINVH